MTGRHRLRLVLAALGLIFVLFMLWRLAPPAGTPRVESPPKQERVPVAPRHESMSKTIFLERRELGEVTDIVAGELDASSGPEIGIAGSCGAILVTESGKEKSFVAFRDWLDHVDIVDVEGDGVCEYLNRGSWSCDVVLMDHEGKAIWTHGGPSGVDDACAGDLDGDGKLEFVVGFNGGGGVRLLETNGKEQWTQPDGNVWHVEITDANGDGDLDIVHSNAAGQITVRNARGSVVSRAHPTAYCSDFSLCRFPEKKGGKLALLAENETIWLFDYDGTAITRLKAPGCGSLGHARGVPVKLESGKGEYLAVVVDFQGRSASRLYVYDSAGALVYRDALSEACASIAALSLGKSPTQTLLVGGDRKVWQYSLVGTGRRDRRPR